MKQGHDLKAHNGKDDSRSYRTKTTPSHELRTLNGKEKTWGHK